MSCTPQAQAKKSWPACEEHRIGMTASCRDADLIPKVAGAGEVFERLGSPEGELAIAEAVIYLACAAKSNAAYVAYNSARAFVSEDESRPVPVHLRNAPTKLMKQLGHGREYRYAHDESDAFAAGENYLPEGMPAPGFYRPVSRGLELKIAEKMASLREINQAKSSKN
jgi:putative ATPase